ncbi:MAG: helix-turn-helix domain-containing protein, partial [Oscillospiraceae bacterium]|nr:helix-turn-helix domain-containing protein [Oscillospiraceae bacterium]
MSRKRKSPARGPVPQGVIPRESQAREDSTTDQKPCQERRRRRTDQKEIEKFAYWAVIPGEVMRSEKLSDCEKLLYAEVSTLAQGTGYCFAGNDYIAEQMNKSERTIARGLSKLSEMGFIRIEAVHGQRNAVLNRRIYAGLNPAQPPDSSLDKNGRTESVLPNLSSSSVKNGKTHLIENKTLDHPPKAPQGAARGSKSKATWKPERFEKFWDYYPR